MNEPLQFDLVAIGGSFAGLCAAVRSAGRRFESYCVRVSCSRGIRDAALVRPD
jgi:hypothetical protein